MAKIFKPRRALRSSVKSGSKRTLVLASGELMLVGKTAIGESSRADLYLGDGVSQMQNLTPAIYGDTSEEDMTITDDTSTSASAALGNVTTGKTLGSILGSLKKAISLNASAIATLNDEVYNYRLRINSVKLDSTKFPLTLTAYSSTTLNIMNDLSLLKRLIGYVLNPVTRHEWNSLSDKVIPYGYDRSNGYYRVHIKNTYSESITLIETDIKWLIIYLI